MADEDRYVNEDLVGDDEYAEIVKYQRAYGRAVCKHSSYRAPRAPVAICVSGGRWVRGSDPLGRSCLVVVDPADSLEIANALLTGEFSCNGDANDFLGNCNPIGEEEKRCGQYSMDWSEAYGYVAECKKTGLTQEAWLKRLMDLVTKQTVPAPRPVDVLMVVKRLAAMHGGGQSDSLRDVLVAHVNEQWVRATNREWVERDNLFVAAENGPPTQPGGGAKKPLVLLKVRLDDASLAPHQLVHFLPKACTARRYRNAMSGGNEPGNHYTD